MYYYFDYRYVDVTLMMRLIDVSFVAEEDYVGVRLPKKLTDEVDALVAQGHLGFRSRAEFIADAIRRRLEDLGFVGQGRKRRRE